MTGPAGADLGETPPSISSQSHGEFTIPNIASSIQQHFMEPPKLDLPLQLNAIASTTLPLSEIIGGDIIKIWVGPDEKLFKVHKDLLAQQSYFPYLFDREALSSGRLPPHPHILFDHYGNIFLPDDNPNAFSRLVEFLYRRTIPIIGRQPWRADPDEEVGLAMPLYLIAERLGLYLIMNRVIVEIQRLDQAGELPSLSVDELEQVYENVEDGSKLWEYFMMGVASQLLWGSKDDEWAERFRELCYRNAEIGAEFFRISFQYGTELRTRQPAFLSASKYFYVGPIGCLSFPPLVPDFCGGSVEIVKDADASQAVVEDITAPRLKMEEDEPDFGGGSVEIPKEADTSQVVVEDITSPRPKVEEDEEMVIF